MKENETEKLRKKAKRKYLSSKLAFELLKLPKSEMTRGYAISTACCSQLFVNQEYELSSAFYCKRRWCQICGSIKSATMINKYVPTLDARRVSEELYFVTVTLRTVSSHALGSRIKLMQKTWVKIKDLARKRFSSFDGIKKLELKASHSKYHPHYHILVFGQEQARFIVERWLSLNPGISSPKGQDIRLVYDTEKATLEIFKYATKITCSDDASNQILCSTTEMHTIFCELNKKRIYQTFGKIKAVNEDDFDLTPEIVHKAKGIYQWCGENWYHTEFGQPLTDFKPDTLEINSYR